MNTPYGDTPTSEGDSVYCRGCGNEYHYPVDDDGNPCPDECGRCGVALDLPRTQIAHDVGKAEVMDTIVSLGNRIVLVRDQPNHAAVVRRLWIELCKHRGVEP